MAPAIRHHIQEAPFLPNCFRSSDTVRVRSRVQATPRHGGQETGELLDVVRV